MENHDHNVLQKHVIFFDRNKDGIIYPSETFQGFRAIGCGILLSSAAAVFINVALSGKTRPGSIDRVLLLAEKLLKEVSFCEQFLNCNYRGWPPPLLGKSFSLRFPIEVKNIQMAKHGSDSGVYDKEGRFVASKFEEIFDKHAHTHPNALTSNELKSFIKSNREKKDYIGWLAGYVEWQILYSLCKDKNGLLQKDTIRAAFDGSLFERMEKEKASKIRQID